MSDEKTAADFDDTEIMVKFRSLLSKYRNQGKIAGTASAGKAPEIDKTVPAIGAEAIPLLTDAVLLHPAVIQPQPARLTPIRQVLDAALEDAHIDMDVQDRKALAHALETRLSKQIK
ncbi:MAG: hypothetical protein LZF85_06905 [Nitrosomonas sp.]|uniref:hypothetical protein n=1 Tax=Nitrosomonas sp. TaxID=42353 RepID=UPI0025F1666B|nr:hypothetical protein [Nitrosomonas sp.]UJP04151.1 MAG: hypothetical protein LZF85_06905 [Nitrosomonas sp.]